jgi:hypothetical protein
MSYQAKLHENLHVLVSKMIEKNVNYESFKPKEITLKALVHGGDAGEPVITVMLPEED